MLTRNKKLEDYGIPAEDIEKLNTMLKDFPAKYGYLLTSAALSACPMNPKDFYGYRRKTVAVLYERMRLLGVWEEK